MRAHASGFPNDMHPFAVEHDPLDKFGGNELFFVKGRALKIKPTRIYLVTSMAEHRRQLERLRLVS